MHRTGKLSLGDELHGSLVEQADPQHAALHLDESVVVGDVHDVPYPAILSRTFVPSDGMLLKMSSTSSLDVTSAKSKMRLPAGGLVMVPPASPSIESCQSPRARPPRMGSSPKKFPKCRIVSSLW